MPSRESIYAGILVVAAMSGPIARADSVAAFGVTEYGTASQQCCAGCTDLTYSVSDAQVVNAFDYIGNYTTRLLSANLDVDARDWTDSSKAAWGNDEYNPEGADFTTVSFYSGHGDHTCSSSRWYSDITMGDNGNTCYPSTDQHMLIGDAGGVYVTIFAACQSVQWCVWDADGYQNSTRYNANIVLGFHGDSYDSSANNYEYGDYVRHSAYDGIGENWLDDLHEYTNQCPTVAMTGQSTSFINDYFFITVDLETSDTPRPTHRAKSSIYAAVIPTMAELFRHANYI